MRQYKYRINGENNNDAISVIFDINEDKRDITDIIKKFEEYDYNIAELIDFTDNYNSKILRKIFEIHFTNSKEKLDK